MTNIMNKRYTLPSTLLLFCIGLISACSVEETEPTRLEPAQNDHVLYATIEKPGDPETRAYADGNLRVLWDASDAVSVFKYNTTNLKYIYTGEAGTNAGTFELATSEGTASPSTLENVYAVYPYDESSNRISENGIISVNVPATQVYKEGSFGPGANLMVSSTTGSELYFKNVLGYLKIKLYGNNVRVGRVRIEGNDEEVLAGEANITASVDADPVISLSSTTGDKYLDIVCPDGVTLGSSAAEATEFWFAISPITFKKGFTLTVYEYGTECEFSKATSREFSIERNMMKKMAMLKVEPEGSPEYAVPDLVDLGLSVKWATFNLGATKPEEYGDYFAWGEVLPKENYSDQTYKWSNGSSTSFTKYCIDPNRGVVDGRTQLEPQDDAAVVGLGGEWRMPTNAEWQEIMDHCKGIWTDDYQGSGIAGWIIFSLIEGYSDNSIFLPAAGRIVNDHVVVPNEKGMYWSSTLQEGANACGRDFNYDSGSYALFWYFRRAGQSIRPVVGVTGTIATALSLDKTSLTISLGKTAQLTATITPSDATNKNVSWRSSDTTIVKVAPSGMLTAVDIGEATITAHSVSGNMKADCAITVTEPEYEAVDLGLSVKWATFNVGAASPEERGSLFAWGETEPKENYDWGSYLLAKGGNHSLIKYCPIDKADFWAGESEPDGKTTLELEDDAAYKERGGTWRIPTKDEFIELKENCTFTPYTFNSVNGLLISSKINNNTIFMPKAGNYYTAIGNSGYYWTSTLVETEPYRAYNFRIETSTPYMDDPNRYGGQPIRPVCN